MRWTLIVSGSEAFQREAISGLRTARLVVGATGESSAFGMVRGIDVERVLVDGDDEIGRRFLGALQSLPASACGDLEVVIVGGYPTDRFPVVEDLARALARLGAQAA
jgi:hypothetical protein